METFKKAKAYVSTQIFSLGFSLDEKHRYLYEYGVQRKHFVEKFGWLEVDGDEDVDRYDHDHRTEYLLAVRGGILLSGLRVTETAFEESLSLSMFDKSELQRFKTPEKLKGANVLDVTRLTSRYLAIGQDKLNSKISVSKLMLALAKIHGDNERHFIFTVEDRFIDFMEKNNVVFEILVEADNKKMVLVHCSQLQKSIRGNTFYSIVMMGLRVRDA